MHQNRQNYQYIVHIERFWTIFGKLALLRIGGQRWEFPPQRIFPPVPTLLTILLCITRVGNYESITNWYSLCNPSTRSWIFFMDNMFQRWITTSNPIFNSTILQQCDVFRYIFCDDNFHAKYYFFR